MNSSTIWTRRQFIAASVGAATAFSIRPAHVLGANPPSEQITLGFIGMGSQGQGTNLRRFLQHKAARVVAVCDVFADRRSKAKKMVDAHYGNRDCKAFADFRELLADDGIDAVVISTPDHWHVPMSLMALLANKDVFCEKPTLTIDEGRVLAAAVRRHKAVFQWGIEDRSLQEYFNLAAWVRNGEIGELKRVEVGLPRGKAYPKEEPAPVPDGLDYDKWVGPAPFHPYTPQRTEAMHWRAIRDYSGGMITDWGSHLVDTAQLGADAQETGAVEVEGSGLIPEESMTDVPVEFDLKYRFPNGVVMKVTSSGPSIRFVGTDGWIGNDGWRAKLNASSEKLLKARLNADTSSIGPRPPREQENFLDCVRSRRPTTYTAEIGHRLFTTLHMGHLAIRLGRKLEWDPREEKFIRDEEANSLKSRPQRFAWRL